MHIFAPPRELEYPLLPGLIGPHPAESCIISVAVAVMSPKHVFSGISRQPVSYKKP